MSASLPVYPGPDHLPGLTYGSKWTPNFFNQTATTATGADIDVGIAAYPLHNFELTYEFLRDGPRWGGASQALEFRTLMGFHLAIGGTRGRFLYRNPDDWQAFQNQIGVGDGATKTFLLTRTFGANGYFQTEPVGQVAVNDLFNVYLGGSASPVAPSLYTLNAAPLANTITFATAPAAGQAIAVDMSYFYYCKLAANANSFEKFMDRIWSVDKVQLHSCRAGT